MNTDVIDLTSEEEPSAKKFKLSTYEQIIVLDDEDDIIGVLDKVADLNDCKEVKPIDLENNCESGNCPSKAPQCVAEGSKPQTEPEKDGNIQNWNANQLENSIKLENETILEVMDDNTEINNPLAAELTLLQ